MHWILYCTYLNALWYIHRSAYLYTQTIKAVLNAFIPFNTFHCLIGYDFLKAQPYVCCLWTWLLDTTNVQNTINTVWHGCLSWVNILALKFNMSDLPFKHPKNTLRWHPMIHVNIMLTFLTSLVISRKHYSVSQSRQPKMANTFWSETVQLSQGRGHDRDYQLSSFGLWW